MTCAECGTGMAKGARFCHRCGWDMKLAAAGAASSTAGERPVWKRRLMSVTLIAATLTMLWMMLIPRGEAAALVVGQKAPDFELESLDGGKVRLSALRGEPVIINFWATWCTPCRKEMPDFQAVYDRHKADGLHVLAINVGEARVGIQDFRTQVGFTFPVLLDRGDAAQNAYHILPLPATFFVDREGVIRSIYQYQMSKGQIEMEAVRLLAR